MGGQSTINKSGTLTIKDEVERWGKGYYIGVTVTAKTGNAKITVTACDGSNKSISLTLQVRK